jgi:hypothetical protein
MATSAEQSTADAADAGAAVSKGNGAAAAEGPDADNVARLQLLVTRHVELLERMLLVEQDINGNDNIKRFGELSLGLIHRHTADMRPDMEVDLHAEALRRAMEKTSTTESIITKFYRDGTEIRGPAKDVQNMVEALSRTFFNDLLDNVDNVLTTLSQVDFAVRGRLGVLSGRPAVVLSLVWARW